MRRGFLILLIFSSALLQGCLVYQRSLEPTGYKNTDRPAFKVWCHVNRYVTVLERHRQLRVDINFNDRLRSQVIRDIAIHISTDKNLKFQLRTINMSSAQNQIMPVTDDRYQKNSFAELPVSERLTSLNGSGMNYSFEYRANKNINAQSLQVEVTVTLENGEKLSSSTSYMMNKSHYWTLH